MPVYLRIGIWIVVFGLLVYGLDYQFVKPYRDKLKASEQLHEAKDLVINDLGTQLVKRLQGEINAINDQNVTVPSTLTNLTTE